MNSIVIAAVPLSDDRLVVWFEGGTSKLCHMANFDIADTNMLKDAHPVAGGSQVALGGDIAIDADDLFEKGEEVDFVNDEKMRLLKSLSGIRRSASFSQTRLGEAAGIRQSVISRIEGCEISPQINTLLKLLAPLGKTLAIVDLKDEQ